ncbi:MAG: oligoendopeptidase F [Bacteroidales bacterium]|nr:oligoendopeptidase F [Bacteroidales bacterium]MBN2755606.1 oligoendopeptidase F [Bacteroidales bacterium]
MKKEVLLLIFTMLMFAITTNTLAQTSYKSRDEVPAEYKWNFSDIYADWNIWESEFTALSSQLDEVPKFKGTLAKDVKNLIALQKLNEELSKRAYKVYQYVGLQYTVDTKNMDLLSKLQKVQLLFAQFGVKTSWISPELLSIPEETMKKWIAENAELKDFKFELMDMYRLQKHVLSEDKEQLLSYFRQPNGASSDIYDAVSTTDVKFNKVTLSDGKEYEVTHGVYKQILTNNKNQDERKKAFDAMIDVYSKNKNTYAAIYNGVVQSGWASARARNYQTKLDASLERNDIPKDVYLNLINTVKANTKPLQKYLKLRKEILGLDKYYKSDRLVNLTDFSKSYDYEEAKEIVYQAVAPLGEDYQKKLKVAMSNGWLDVYENPGKRSGAFSSGVYGVHPYMMLNYDGTLDYVFTLAHELGHTMHTWYSDENQPFAKHDYTIFVAEVASTFNERLLLDYMLKNSKDPKERITLLTQAINNISGTFFRQTRFADFEYQVYTRAEQGLPINAEVLADIWGQLDKAYFGDVLSDDENHKYVWGRISHFYGMPYYVYQYATCFASSAQIYKNVTEGSKKEKQEALNKYLTLLKSGGNDHPMNQLKKAGVDLSKPETILAVIKQFDMLVDQLAVEIKNLKK